LEAVGWNLVRFTDEPAEHWRCPDCIKALLAQFNLKPGDL